MIAFNLDDIAGLTRCYNGGNMHKFEARYGDEYHDHDPNPWQRREYYGDVCVWCGKIINVPARPAAEIKPR